MKLVELIIPIQWFATFLLFGLSLYAAQFKHERIARNLIIFLILTGFWCLMSVLIIEAKSLELKIFLNRIKMLFPIFIPLSVLKLCLAINAEYRFLFPWKQIAWITPMIFAGLMISPWHELVITNYQIWETSIGAILTFENGSLFYVHNLYARLSIIAGLSLLIMGTIGQHRFHRKTGYLLMAALFLPFIVDTFGVHLYPSIRFFQLVPVTLSITSGLMIYTLFSHGSLDIVPYARSHVVSFLQEPCLMWDSKGRLIDCNQAATKLFSIPENLREFDSTSLAYLKQNKSELKIKGRHYFVNYQTVHNSKESISGSFSLLQDQTELKLKESELLKLNSVKTNILGVLSHDLGGHIHHLNFSADLLHLNFDRLKDEEKVELSTGIYYLSKEMNAFLSDLLNWSKEQFGEWQVKKTNVSVIPLLTRIKDFMETVSRAKEQQIIVDIAPEMKLNTDEKMLEIILRNLLYNALKHSPSNSEILIKSVGQNTICIQNPGQLANLKELNSYFSTNDSSKAPSQGLGFRICREFSRTLGLSIIFQNSDGLIKAQITLPDNHPLG